MTPAERDMLKRWADREAGALDFKGRFLYATSFVFGLIGVGVSVVAGSSGSWLILMFMLAGAAVGGAVDLVQARRRLRERQARAAVRWQPLFASGMVEHVVAHASAVVRIDDPNEADSGWFLQVGPSEILCVWDPLTDAVSEHVDLVFVAGESVTPTLQIAWSGNPLPLAQTRRELTRRERQPEQGEILHGTLEQLDALLRLAANNMAAKAEGIGRSRSG